MAEKGQEQKVRWGNDTGTGSTIERLGNGCPVPKTQLQTYHPCGVKDATLNLCNVQPPVKVFTD